MAPPPSGSALSHRQPLTLAVEYGEPAVLQSDEFCSKVVKDLALLGLPRPSAADIERKDGGRLDINLICVPFELERVQALEFGRDDALNARKSHCGIKRIWSLSRTLKSHKLIYSGGYKRQHAESEYQMVPETHQKRMRWDINPQRTSSLSTSSQSGSPPPVSINSSEDCISSSEGANPSNEHTPVSPSSSTVRLRDDAVRLPQNREAFPLARRHTTGVLSDSDTIFTDPGRWGPIKTIFAAEAGLEGVENPERTIETAYPAQIPSFAQLRIQPLDQTNLSYPPTRSPIEANIHESVVANLEQSRQGRDPRISWPRRHSVASTNGFPNSYLEEDYAGYELGTELVLVETSETHRCGREARIRRQFAREKLREADMRKEVEQERDEALEWARKMESELRKEKMWGRKTRLEVEVGRGIQRSLEVRIEDMRKECQRPFVVPALLDAFLKIGEWGDKLLEE